MALTFEEMRSYCLSCPGRITEETPFGDDVRVFKVHGKIFALVDLMAVPLSMNLKCDPERALELREQYEAVHPGYHMNKRHWNSVVVDGSIRQDELLAMIGHSYDLVVARLPKKVRERMKKRKQ